MTLVGFFAAYTVGGRPDAAAALVMSVNAWEAPPAGASVSSQHEATLMPKPLVQRYCRSWTRAAATAQAARAFLPGLQTAERQLPRGRTGEWVMQLTSLLAGEIPQRHRLRCIR